MILPTDIIIAIYTPYFAENETLLIVLYYTIIENSGHNISTGFVGQCSSRNLIAKLDLPEKDNFCSISGHALHRIVEEVPEQLENLRWLPTDDYLSRFFSKLGQNS